MGESPARLIDWGRIDLLEGARGWSGGRKINSHAAICFSLSGMRLLARPCHVVGAVC